MSILEAPLPTYLDPNILSERNGMTMYGQVIVQLSHHQRGMPQEVPYLLHAHRHRIRTKSLKENLIFVDDTRASVGPLHRVRDHLPRATVTTVFLARLRLVGALWWGVGELLANHRMRAAEEVLQLVLRHLFGTMARNLRGRGNTCCQWGATGRSGLCLRGHPETLAAGREANIEHIASPFVHTDKTRSGSECNARGVGKSLDGK